MHKTVISAQELLEDSYRLGLDILESGFEPTLIIAIWRGGTPVGMAVQEILRLLGSTSDHIAIRTSSYTGVDQRGSRRRARPQLHHQEDLPRRSCADRRRRLRHRQYDRCGHRGTSSARRARDNTPEDIRVAVPWFKPTRNETKLLPDYFIHETAEWLVFPHELDALTPDELRESRPEIAEIIERARASAA